MRATSNLCAEITLNEAILSIDPFSDTDVCHSSNPEELGNGLCSPYSNTKACGWDGGDCCTETCVYNNETSLSSCYFDTLQCLDPDPMSHAVGTFSRRPSDFEPSPDESDLQPKANCVVDLRVGDGLCNDDLNFEECAWDGGDCCPSTCLADLPGCKWNKCRNMNCKNPNPVPTKESELDPPRFYPELPEGIAFQCREDMKDPVVSAVAPPTLDANRDVIVFNPRVTFNDTVIQSRAANSFEIKRTLKSDEDMFNRRAVMVQTIVVEDTVPPVLNIVFSGIGPDGIESKDMIAPDSGSTATDNCQDGASLSFEEVRVDADGSCLNTYSISRVWGAVDTSGNQANATENFNVVDSTPPLAVAEHSYCVNLFKVTKSKKESKGGSFKSKKESKWESSNKKCKNGKMAKSKDKKRWVRLDLLGNQFAYNSTKDNCGSADPKYCNDTASAGFVSCTSSHQTTSKGHDGNRDCVFLEKTKELFLYMDSRDGDEDDNMNPTHRTYTVKVEQYDNCGNSVMTEQKFVVENECVVEERSCDDGGSIDIAESKTFSTCIPDDYAKKCKETCLDVGAGEVRKCSKGKGAGGKNAKSN